MLKYKWKTTVFEADATAVGQEVEKLEINGKIENDDLVNFASKNKDSELYKCFEWNDSVAGEKYRKMQASTILTSLAIVISEADEKKDEEIIKAYVTVKESDSDKNVRKNIYQVMKNDDEYEQLKQKAYREFLSCKEKYETIVDLSDLKDIIFDLYKSV